MEIPARPRADIKTQDPRITLTLYTAGGNSKPVREQQRVPVKIKRIFNYRVDNDFFFIELANESSAVEPGK